MNRYAITPLAEDPVVLKLDDCADWAALHERIRKTFGFPAYYGRNWDAMWDCLRDVFFPAVPRRIVVEGLGAMAGDLQKYSDTLREIFADLQAEYPLLDCLSKYVDARRSSRTCRRSIPGSRLCTDDCCPAFFS